MSAINKLDKTFNIIESFRRWVTQTAREFNVKNDDIENIIKDYYNLPIVKE